MAEPARVDQGGDAALKRNGLFEQFGKLRGTLGKGPAIITVGLL